MNIDVRKVRRSYWQARFANLNHPQHVGEGRTKAEAIGALILSASRRQDIHACPYVRELPPGELAHLPAGR